MGTFKISTPVSIVSGRTVQNTFNGSSGLTTDAAIIAGLIATTGSISGAAPNSFEAGGGISGANSAVSGTIRFALDQTTAIISLDGNPVISFNSLPAGFTPQSCTLNISAAASDGSNLFMQFDSLTEGVGFNPTGAITGLPYTFSYRFPTVAPPTMLQIINNGFGFRFAFLDNTGYMYIWNFSLSGTYIIQKYSWTLPITANVKAGDQVTINGDPTLTGTIAPGTPTGAGGKLDGVTQLHVQYIDSSGKLHDNVVYSRDFIFQTPQKIIFYFPQFGNIITGSSVKLYAVGNGVQFSGSVLIGTLTVTFVDSSGVYVLVPLKTNDTIYDRTTPGATLNVNIPDPFIKTGFIP